ncbi:MAG: ISAs1 family transposase [Lachnospiraceae bacterium]|nr:ISAs1 family transposase [Lachnospiraceae bacterium]
MYTKIPLSYGICLAQRFIGEKTNEIPAAQELLKRMDLKGTIVTADALNCQKDIVSAIVESKGDYVLSLKGNQALFYEEVQGFFDEEKKEESRKNGNGYKKTVEKEHGELSKGNTHHRGCGLVCRQKTVEEIKGIRDGT